MRFLVIGCGRLGSGLAQLLSLNGHDVRAVDHDPAALGRLGPAFRGQTFCGGAFDRDVLVQAGIQRADGLAAVTASDDANLVTTRIAREVFRVPKVVARLYDPGKATLCRHLGVQAIATTTWGISRIADLLDAPSLQSVLSLGSGGVDVVEVEVPALLHDRSLSQVALPGEVHVVAITRDGKTYLPSPSAAFRAGDMVHLAVAAGSAGRLHALLGLT